MWWDTNVSEDLIASIFRPSETLVSYNITTRCHNPEDNDLIFRICRFSRKRLYIFSLAFMFPTTEIYLRNLRDGSKVPVRN